MPAQPPSARSLTPADGVALKEHVESLLAAQRCYFDARIASLEKATEIAADSMAVRLAGMNEIRETMRDQSGRFATRDEVATAAEKLRIQLDLKADRIDEQLDSLKSFRDRLDGKASQQSVILATILGISGLIFGVVDLLLKLLV